MLGFTFLPFLDFFCLTYVCFLCAGLAETFGQSFGVETAKMSSRKDKHMGMRGFCLYLQV